MEHCSERCEINLQKTRPKSRLQDGDGTFPVPGLPSLYVASIVIQITREINRNSRDLFSSKNYIFAQFFRSGGECGRQNIFKMSQQIARDLEIELIP